MTVCQNGSSRNGVRANQGSNHSIKFILIILHAFIGRMVVSYVGNMLATCLILSRYDTMIANVVRGLTCGFPYAQHRVWLAAEEILASEGITGAFCGCRTPQKHR